MNHARVSIFQLPKGIRELPEKLILRILVTISRNALEFLPLWVQKEGRGNSVNINRTICFFQLYITLCLNPPFYLRNKAAWCTELENVDIFLFAFRVTKEVLSIYANLSSFSPSRMHHPSTIILCREFCPTPYRVWGDHRDWTNVWKEQVPLRPPLPDKSLNFSVFQLPKHWQESNSIFHFAKCFEASGWKAQMRLFTITGV